VSESTRTAANLTEFTALKAEITNRTNLQNSLATFTLVAAGTLGSFALSSGQNHRLVLLLLVPLNAATGFLWLDHAHSIYKAGNYIRLKLWAELRQAAQSSMPTYEEFVLQDRPIWLERSVFILPFFILFIGPMIGALVSTLGNAYVVLLGVFWALDVIIVCFFAMSWVTSIREFLRPPRTLADLSNTQEPTAWFQLIRRRSPSRHPHE